ncbi:alanine--tRNA ligase [Maridesulfovibrio salexigens]|uniref:Alanine--tRNA ligase n=1 Tax=Maridesulfovibrio salexigens (strain ATCC 14822 / DSM 2638 / NCIMB 8403 / VKM B-1763) TaxID=526222 RepID=C6C1J8_MARSD|nr:alanine--tRNA ligase [Maridesulfovibrio salexigens]ACS81173.1 alanyl-tRNA synthetase [Maridesulfovibrio salexigens DSM 2638]
MKASEIREKFLKYFEKNGHTIVDSSSLVPKDDPTLLFTNAGMVQFKNTFLGQEKRDYVRATTSQKCLRVGGKHNDLENVGRTARHHTFFEMLGNFSFGDYFKEDAIKFCWGFLTEELGLPKDKLYVTIYTDDDEADELWQKVVNFPAERIYRLGEKDNFWSMGDTGPCGPCSEVHIDQGEDMSCGPNCGIGKCDCDRYLEIWNLVFMQYDQDEEGNRVPLPRPSIDTGMGLERITAVCQGVQSNFETDIFQPMIQAVAKKAGVKYKEDSEIDTALQVIADHSRSIAFLITDQILPSNEGRGYVLRRLIRRAFRFGRLLGLTDPFLHETTAMVVEQMSGQFPELLDNKDFMARMVKEEEERFSQTLDKGLIILEEEMEELKKAGKNLISGETAFKLYDTYGFPLDIINDVAEKQEFEVDEDGFNAAMKEQKDRAKAAWKGSGEKNSGAIFRQVLEAGLKNSFTGYSELTTESRIVNLLSEEGEHLERITQGNGGWIITAATPFYGESGGQMGDTGAVGTLTGNAEVLETVKASADLTASKVFVSEGELLLEQEAKLEVSPETRVATERNHTVTHLLHAALKKVLGDHVKQSGSLVGPDRLRFDFTHIAAMTPEEIGEVENEVNRAILGDTPVVVQEMSNDEAAAKGATALFGEKYGDVVRVVEIPGESMELCGGTHLKATGEAGTFVIQSESGVAAGIRRIEAATGWNSLKFLQEQRAEVVTSSAMLKAAPGQLADRIAALQSQVKELTKANDKLQSKLASGAGADLMSSIEEIGGVKVLAAKLEVTNVKALRDQADALRSKMDSGIFCLVAQVDDNKVSLIIAVTKDLHDRFQAGALIKPVAAEVGGGGGGRPDMAQAGGTNPAGIEKAFATLKKLVADS